MRLWSLLVWREGEEIGKYITATGSGNGSVWWNKFGESEEQKQTVYYTLCAAYALVSITALVQLSRIHLRVPAGWTTQKVFHLMNFLVNGLRAVIFGLYKSVYLLKSEALRMVLMDLPRLLFFSTYTLLVLFWAEIYHQARNLPVGKLRPTNYTINGFIYFAQVCIWAYVTLSRGQAAMEAAKLFISVISFLAALGFLIYGGRLFIMLRHFPIESRGRQKKLNEVCFVTGICCACFLARCLVVSLLFVLSEYNMLQNLTTEAYSNKLGLQAAISAFDRNADVDVLDHPILNLCYYLLVEILPSALVLFILRKLPPRRASTQYQPIN